MGVPFPVGSRVKHPEAEHVMLVVDVSNDGARVICAWRSLAVPGLQYEAGFDASELRSAPPEEAAA